MDTLDLEQPKKLQWQKMEFYVFRGAWLIFSLALLAGLAGGFGQGWISGATARGKSATIEYDWLARYAAPAKLQIFLGDLEHQETCELALANNFIRGVEIDEFKPQPLRTRVGEDRVTFVFATDGADKIAITCDYQHQQAGWHESLIWPDGDEPLRLRQWVYP
ncbi:MAG: hypothetical protein SFX18_07040 [Pirellulales bacterium]|nr:hypothetical protein [Pirellulales bacterium]